LAYKCDILLKQENNEGVITCCHKILEIDPQNSDAFNYKGRALNKQKKYEEALEYFDKGLEYLCKDT